MTDDQVTERLKVLGEITDYDKLTNSELTEKLKKMERTRHLIVWSDHSCIMNHGHLLLTVNCLYDPAFYHTREEMMVKMGADIDVEAIVQTPQLYILGRCTDKLCDQLCYVHTRMEDVQALTNLVNSRQGVQIADKLRLLHGDHPEQSAESGQQDGGHYPCCLCPEKVTDWSDLIKCYRAPCISLNERIVNLRYFKTSILS